MAYLEKDILDAISKYEQGNQSLRRISREFGIPRSTLRDRISGRETRQEASQPRQILSRVQEDHLTQWVLTQVALGVPPTHAQLREFACRILEA